MSTFWLLHIIFVLVVLFVYFMVEYLAEQQERYKQYKKDWHEKGQELSRRGANLRKEQSHD